jgi:hypothetical protein
MVLGSEEIEEGSEMAPDVEAAWTVEIDRRMLEIREGRAKLVNWEDVMARGYALIEAARRRQS